MIDEKIYSSHYKTFDIPHYPNRALLKAKHDTPNDARSNLTYRILEEEHQLLLKKKEELAQKSAQQKIPSFPHLLKLMEAEKQSLLAVIEQRDSLLESYRREANSEHTEGVWNIERSRDHYTRRYQETYDLVYKEAKDKMDRNTIDLRSTNCLLQQQNESFVKEIERMRKKRIEDIALLKAEVEQQAHARIQSCTDELDRHMGILQRQGLYHRDELKAHQADLEKRLKQLDVIWAKAKNRNDDLFRGGIEYELSQQMQEENMKQLAQFDQVNNAIKSSISEEREALEQRKASLLAQIETRNQQHQQEIQTVICKLDLTKLAWSSRTNENKTSVSPS